MLSMISPTICLSLLTAILASDLSTSTALSATRGSTSQSSPVISDEPTEEQLINDEAKRSLGSELLRL